MNENSLTALPAPVLLFTNLVELDLKHNRLTSLPPAISRLQVRLVRAANHTPHATPHAHTSRSLQRHTQNLVWLNLDENKLESLPDELGRLTNLTSLFLSYNRLTSLPDTMSRLTALTYTYRCFPRVLTTCIVTLTRHNSHTPHTPHTPHTRATVEWG